MSAFFSSGIWVAASDIGSQDGLLILRPISLGSRLQRFVSEDRSSRSKIAKKSFFPPVSTALHHSSALLSASTAGRFGTPSCSRFCPRDLTSQIQFSNDCV